MGKNINTHESYTKFYGMLRIPNFLCQFFFSLSAVLKKICSIVVVVLDTIAVAVLKTLLGAGLGAGLGLVLGPVVDSAKENPMQPM